MSWFLLLTESVLFYASAIDKLQYGIRGMKLLFVLALLEAAVVRE